MRLTPDETAVLDSLADGSAAIVDRAVGWCAINSGSRNLEGLEAMRRVLADAFAVLPGELEVRPLAPTIEIAVDGREREQPTTPAIAVCVRPDAPVQVVLTGHYDTVFPADSRFQTVVTRADGALNGPGVADMKGGVSVILAALQAFETSPDKARVGYRVLLSPDEEVGSISSGPVLAEFGRLGHVGLTYEPSMLPDGTLASERKGSGNFHVRVTGRTAHAGRAFGEGRNAITAAARIAGALDALNGRRDGVTLNIARIDGGAPLNVVPDIAVLRFNVRFPDADAGAWLEAEIARAMTAGAGEGLAVSLHGGVTRPAKPFNAAQTALFGKVREAGALIGQDIAWKPSGGVCEGNNLFAVGLPNVDTLGVRGGDIHSENEFAWPDSFAERARLSTLILMKLASGEIDARGIHALMKASA